MILKTSANVLSATYMVNLASVREDRLTFRFLDDYVTDLLVLYNHIYVLHSCKWNALATFGFQFFLFLNTYCFLRTYGKRTECVN